MIFYPLVIIFTYSSGASRNVKQRNKNLPHTEDLATEPNRRPWSGDARYLPSGKIILIKRQFLFATFAIVITYPGPSSTGQTEGFVGCVNMQAKRNNGMYATAGKTHPLALEV